MTQQQLIIEKLDSLYNFNGDKKHSLFSNEKTIRDIFDSNSNYLSESFGMENDILTENILDMPIFKIKTFVAKIKNIGKDPEELESIMKPFKNIASNIDISKQARLLEKKVKEDNKLSPIYTQVMKTLSTGFAMYNVLRVYPLNIIIGCLLAISISVSGKDVKKTLSGLRIKMTKAIRYKEPKDVLGKGVEKANAATLCYLFTHILVYVGGNIAVLASIPIAIFAIIMMIIGTVQIFYGLIKIDKPKKK